VWWQPEDRLAGYSHIRDITMTSARAGIFLAESRYAKELLQVRRNDLKYLQQQRVQQTASSVIKNITMKSLKANQIHILWKQQVAQLEQRSFSEQLP
jgi:hypothetical protein